ncbi:MAG: TonB-dependent receptor [Bernardetiaceae bacterium]|nr:TonB-dependent receptor [Bernardetiaceae bacterium]
MKRITVILYMYLLLSSWQFLYAQNAELKGKLTSFETNAPLAYAQIGFPQLGLGTVSDTLGHYKIVNIPVGTYRLEVRLNGYKRIAKLITISSSETLDLDFQLEEKTEFLDEIVIIDKQSGLTVQSPYSISSINTQDIYLKGNPSGIMGMIREDPSVYAAEMGQGIVKPFIRGLGFSRVVTLFQGSKLENHQWGADHGLGLNDLGVSKVDIIKGPASILYGSGAIGGILLLKDDEYYLDNKELNGRLGMTYNSVSGGMRPTLSLGKSFENGFFIAADGAYENHADYVDGEGRIIGNSRFNSQTFRFHTGVKNENFENKISYTYLNQNLGIIEEDEMEEGESLATTRYDRNMQLPFQKVNDHIITYRQNTNHKKWSTSLNLSYHLNNREEIEDDFDELDLGLRQTHFFYNARASHQTTEAWQNTFGVQGSFLQSRNKEEAEEILIPDANYTDVGLYYLTGVRKGKAFLQGGLRYDVRRVNAFADAEHLIEYGYELPGNPTDRRLSSNFSGLTSSLGLSYDVTPQNMLKFNLATGFRAPDLAELYSNGPHPGTNRFEVGNANFDREQSYQADLNWIHESEKIDFSFAVYANRIENYIFFSGTGEILNSGLEIWKFQQSNAFLYGAELQASYRIMPQDKLKLLATANLVRGRDIEATMPLTFIPADNYSLSLQSKPFAQKPTQLFVTFRYVDMQNRPGINELQTDAYTLLNAGVQHKISWNKRNLHVGITGFNLLNQTYIDHMSILRAFNVTHAGRNLMLNAMLEF